MSRLKAEYKHCTQCCTLLVFKVPEGDTHERAVCPNCDTIFYNNPKIVTGVIPMYKGKVLLCERAIAPRKGYWTIPSGFMENGETLTDAALREAKEEAGITPQIQFLHTVYSLPYIGQMYFLFMSECPSPAFENGIETTSSKWFSEAEIPWDQLAFSSVEFALKRLHHVGAPHYGVCDSKKPST
jgi:ADP-ribose pyrophosphatase YjhB (NUDIX family)